MAPSIVSVVRMTSPIYLLGMVILSVILIGLGAFGLYNLYRDSNTQQNKKNETSRLLLSLGMGAIGAIILLFGVRTYRKIQTSNEYAERIGGLRLIGALIR